MASLMPIAKQQYLDSAGNPLSGGKVYTYAAGTTTPLATYTDAGGLTPNANPVVLDARGEASIFFGSNQYKVVIKDAAGATIWSADNLGSGATQSDLASAIAAYSATSGSSLIGFLQSGTGAAASTVQTKLRERLSLKDFGAKGDAVTDDTASIQAALYASVGKRLYAPAGTYKFTSVTIPVGTYLYGDGDGITIFSSSTSGNAFAFTDSTSHRVTLKDFTLQQSGSVSGNGISATDSYWLSTENVHVKGFINNIYASKSLYHTHKRLFSENSTNGVNYYGAAGVWNTDWFNNVLTFDTCRFSSCTSTGISVKGCEVVLINPDFSGMTTANAIGCKIYGESSSYYAHGVKIVAPYVESTDIPFSFSYAFADIDGGFVQGGPSAGASAYTSIIDVDNSIVRWNGKPRDQDYWDYGWRVTNNSELVFDSYLSGSVKASSTVDATSFVAQTFQGSFTATLNGCTTTPTVTAKYVVNQGQVTLSIPANTATSNSTGCTITGLPAALNPARDQIVTGSIFDSGTELLGAIRLASSGTIVLYKGAYGTAFTASGTKGHREITLSYQLP